MPGPLTLDRVVVTAPGGVGRPSSVTVPDRLATAGKVVSGRDPQADLHADILPVS